MSHLDQFEYTEYSDVLSFYFGQEIHFLGKFSQKIKIVSLHWNLGLFE